MVVSEGGMSLTLSPIWVSVPTERDQSRQVYADGLSSGKYADGVLPGKYADGLCPGKYADGLCFRLRIYESKRGQMEAFEVRSTVRQ